MKLGFLAKAFAFWTVSMWALADTLPAQVGLREGFEGPQPTWRATRGTADYRLEAHQRVGEEPHSGAACEYLQVITNNQAASLSIVTAIPPARVIDELSANIWIRSDRLGIQFLARVVFPRSIDPQTGQPATVWIPGTTYTTANRWEQLRLDDITKQVAMQARVLRAQTNQDIDTREAVLDQFQITLFTGAGRSRLWIDDLEVTGVVNSRSGASVELPRHEELPPGARAGLVSSSNPRAPSESPRLNGSVLLVGQRPFFPRIVEYQGEPLAFIKNLGFNAIRIRELPRADFLNEAARHGLWVVCPPPMPVGDRDSLDTAALAPIGGEFDPVLAWHLGEGLTARELDVVKHWATRVRQADRRQRPLVCSPSTRLADYGGPSRADLLIVDRYVPATTFELSRYREWLRERPRLARPGMPIWTTIPTEPADSLANQLNGLSGGRQVDILTGSETTRLLTYTALSAGVRGLIFASHSRLDANDAATRWRAAQLELLNLELDLAEPWLAGGSVGKAAVSSDPEIVATVTESRGSYLLLPQWCGKGAQYVAGSPTNERVPNFVIPGAHAAASAYEIRPGDVRLLPPDRVTGGLSITVDNFSLTSLVLLTQDMMGEVQRRASTSGDRATKLWLETTRIKLQLDDDLYNRLRPSSRALPHSAEQLQTARSELRFAESALASNSHAEAMRHIHTAQRNLRAMERAQWQDAVGPLYSPAASPFAVSTSTLPQHFALLQNVERAHRQANRLPEGNFEDLGRLLNAGWKHYQHPQYGVRMQLPELSDTTHFEGGHSLHLIAAAESPEAVPAQVESPPLWIVTPEIDVEPGTLLRISYRVLVPNPIKGSPDGFLVIDSLGGEALAERVQHSPEWLEIVAYRIADATRKLSVTFALTGMGDVWLDAVSVEALVPSDGRSLNIGRLPP